MPDRRTVLIISQTYPPDPAALGRHLGDAGSELAARGYRVVCYTARRGYDDPTQVYPKRETLEGVTVRRLPLSNFGKGSIAIRLLGGLLFCIQAGLRGVFTRDLKLILISTSPPMAPLAGLFVRFFRRAPMLFWGMDINPDQMVAMGKIGERSLPARLFNAMVRATLKRSDTVVALDPYMGQTLDDKHPIADKLVIHPPWAHDVHIEPIEHTANPFRDEHNLQNKRVFMYSGNISPAHPMDTFLEAARRTQDDDAVRFVFIGGGQGKQHIETYVDKHKLTNTLVLPFQPLDRLRFSLSAADVHLVSMGNNMVGIVHPCKIYGAMAAARPLLLAGPRASHVGEIIDRFRIGWSADHDDHDAMEQAVRHIAHLPDGDLTPYGQRALQAQRQDLSMAQLNGHFCDLCEATLRREPLTAPPTPA